MQSTILVISCTGGKSGLEYPKQLRSIEPVEMSFFGAGRAAAEIQRP
jgi:hypothetical protein